MKLSDISNLNLQLIPSTETVVHLQTKSANNSAQVMDPVRGHGGIHMLLAAEQEAQQIVSSARNLKTGRLKQAKDEAERDAAAYRASLEEDYQRKVSESTGSSGWNVKRLEKETETKIQNLKNASSAIHADVINMLLKHVTTVQT
ncbi:hypothetical protein C4D60_Mb05t02290 [Musa balbisiana]|uniref:V-type proton ATPase subunit G n=1 Tax=Musa balbisiana TaxID=52838 RepID=A0A4S8JT55_MUSBA|nr:hypothetical protein C4D60_Mb05t02290 [Musa balbisiana]